ncbi:Cupredoxin [Radiomyces spectabilis]|uniref:Cupredoxin n=1 Tax=Radiomyces spectabilis TaxID=64574 RepID=UPI00221F8CE9|nr:Cupredoxin [Radiomyces spectabilis]KAI8394176.1 Cupredoxin [Radiomyces spectabilis]
MTNMGSSFTLQSWSFRAVMLLFLVMLSCTSIAAAPVRKVRDYFITAEEIVWNYAPNQWDNFRDQPLTELPSALYTVKNETRIGSSYVKCVYRQYMDKEFTLPLTHDGSLGLLGPIIRAEAGDQIRVLFYNKATKPFSLHPHTATFTSVPGQSIQPGNTYQYIWDVPADFTFPTNQSSVLWTYISRADPLADLNAGLLGPIVIYKAGTLAKPSPGSMFEKPQGIDQEIFTIMMTTDEGHSKYLIDSAAAAGIDEANLQHLTDTDPLFLESNRMYHINGYVYNNNEAIRLYYGHAVRWYLISFGLADDDVHTAHWHGATLLQHGHRVDVVDLMPVSFETLDLMPDNEGQWLFHCHVAQHFEAGMTAFYEVEKLEYTGDEGWG